MEELSRSEKNVIKALRALRKAQANYTRVQNGTYGGNKKAARETVASAKRLVKDALALAGV